MRRRADQSTSALRVLIVEDDAMIGQLLGETLEDMGYDVCATVPTEEEAVAGAALHKPGLMIVDERLREGSGSSAADRIRRTGHVPCVFISGAPRFPARWGACVLQKPVLGPDLIRAIEHVLAHRAASYW